jgi:hypothetical protein
LLPGRQIPYEIRPLLALSRAKRHARVEGRYAILGLTQLLRQFVILNYCRVVGIQQHFFEKPNSLKLRTRQGVGMTAGYSVSLKNELCLSTSKSFFHVPHTPRLFLDVELSDFMPIFEHEITLLRPKSIVFFDFFTSFLQYWG